MYDAAFLPMEMNMKVIPLMAMPGWFQLLILVLFALAIAPAARCLFQLYRGDERGDLTYRELAFVVVFLLLMFSVAVGRCVIMPTYFNS